MPSWAKWGLSLAIAVGLIWVGWRVSYVLVTLHVLVCFVLVIVIMLQSGNAADLAGAFGGAGSQTAFGPRGTATALSRLTTWCAVIFMITSIALTILSSRRTGGSMMDNVKSPTQALRSRAPAAAGDRSAAASTSARVKAIWVAYHLPSASVDYLAPRRHTVVTAMSRYLG